MGKDILGSFHVPQHLLDKAAAYVAPVVNKPKPKAKPTPPPTTMKVIHGGEWQTVTTYKGSNGSSVHTVEGRRLNSHDPVTLKCSCQGFRIQKKGFCKHTRLAQQEFDL